MSLAVIVIASEKRKDTTFPLVMDSVVAAEPDEIVSVADFPLVGIPWDRHLVVQPMLKNTIDALVKRDVGWMATTAENVMYLCDDHRMDLKFVAHFEERYAGRGWDMLAPSRYVIRDGERVILNMGMDQGYIGGHGGIYRRWVGKLLPWSAGPHHPNWDVMHTHLLRHAGAELAYAGTDLAIEDIEGGTPWL